MKTSDKLVQLLEAAGFSRVNITSNGRKGRDEKICWGGSAYEGKLLVNLFSYQTMTLCVREGIEVHPDDDFHRIVIAKGTDGSG